MHNALRIPPGDCLVELLERNARGAREMRLLYDETKSSDLICRRTSATEEAVGQVITSKDSAEMQSPHVLASPPMMSLRCSAVVPVALRSGSSK